MMIIMIRHCVDFFRSFFFTDPQTFEIEIVSEMYVATENLLNKFKNNEWELLVSYPKKVFFAFPKLQLF